MPTLPASEERKLEDAARAGWLYYVAGKTQDEIARQLHTSRQSAQRLVALSISAGLIRVRVEHPIRKCMELATQLQDKFGLSHCEVVPSDDSNPSSTAGLAQAGAAEIERRLKQSEPQTIALGTGRVLRACADELRSLHCPHHQIVSLVGNIADDGSASRYDVAVHVAERAGAPYFPMPLPVIARSTDSKAQWHALPHVKNVQQLAMDATVAFVGIGNLGTVSPLHDDGFIGDAELATLQEQGATGEVISWIYDKQGHIIDCEINQRVTSVPISGFTRTPVIGIAAGEEKVAAIRGALLSGLITGLITNEYTAGRLLEGESSGA
ncbi:sugar-binding transcriptional regulator [Alteromonas halophila]|uniref:DNA-binding transcriptional regulator n=1 Tax=Alteromonas halophila TaxID=516698 RepID=A0A918JPW4_9ALTE|nr:sugar-binding transcriptional regulator [Alteromonas halophila]GGW93244.1 DNA-binding transcriptional regulator [Alteromonas halophila]